MTTTTHGPFRVSNGTVATGIQVERNQFVETISSGQVDFGGGILGLFAPVLDPDGENWETPPDYPAPSLRKNSLICKIGDRFYQGGSNRSFTAQTAGELLLLPNDPTPQDNSRGWQVIVRHTHPDPTARRVGALSLRVARIEVLQSVQRADNSVVLIAGKHTLVRVYVESGLTDGIDRGSGPNVWPGVQGRVTVSQPDPRSSRGETRVVAVPFGPSDQTALALPVGAHDRSNRAHSLNFWLPALPAPGPMRIEADVDLGGGPTAQPVGSDAQGRTTVTFIQRPVQPLVPILITNLGSGQPPATMGDFARVLEGATARYPVSLNGFGVRPPVSLVTRQNLDSGVGWFLLVLSIGVLGIQFPDGMRGMRAGVVRVGRERGVLGLGLSGVFAVAAEGDGAPANFAHEMGHAFGFGHALCGDPSIPLDDRLPPRTDEPAWDYARNQMMRAGEPGDLMSYCPPMWPSIATYRLLAEAVVR